MVCSCANYRLAGTGRPLPFDSICVPPVKNISYAPQVAALLSNAVINELSRVPNLSVENADEADAVLEIKIVDYIRRTVATQGRDTELAAASSLELIASCTLKNLKTGEVIFSDRKVRARNVVYTLDSNDQIGEEYQNMPILARELAVRIKDTVIGIW